MDYEQNEQERAVAERVKALFSLKPADSRRWFQSLGNAGLFEILERRESRLAALLAQKELDRAAPWLCFGSAMHGLAASLLSEREALAAPLRRGERIAALAFSEEGRPTEALETKLEPRGGGFVLTGRKTQVGLAPEADLLLVLGAGPDGLRLCAIERTAKGVEVEPPIDLLGLHGLALCPVRFADVLVEGDRVLAPKTDPVAVLRSTEDRMATALALGLGSVALEEARQFAGEAPPGGKPPAAQQLVRFQLAEMLCDLQTADLLACRAASADARGDREADVLWLCAKVFATEMASRVSDQASRILGAAGFCQSHPVARAAIDARFGPILGHSSNAARMAIADRLLARYL